MLGSLSRDSSESNPEKAPAPKTYAGWLALPLSALIAAAACSTDDTPNQQVNNPAVGTGGTTAGTAVGTTAGTSTGTTAGTAPGTTAGTSTGTTAGTLPGTTAGTSVGTTAGTGLGSTAGTTGGSTAGGTGGLTAGTSSTGGTGGTGATGGTGGSTGGSGFPKCDTTGTTPNLMPCGSFVTSGGVTMEFGPYGSQMDRNVGAGFETPDEGLANAICGVFAASFGADPAATDKLLNLGDLKMTQYTVYRPAKWPEGKVPIITWGNGTCAQPEGYGALLRYIASHGFFIVAANNRFVGDGTYQRKGLDFAFAANADSKSPYFGKLDTTKVAAAGHSQGGMGTIAAASDARISNVIIYNGGDSASKPFFAISGDRDLFASAAADLKGPVNAAAKAAFLWFHKIPGTGSSDGHLTLMQQPERVAPASVAWFKLLLNNDPAAREYFVGTPCKLCGQDADFEFGQKGL